MSHIPADSAGFFGEDWGPRVINPDGDAVLETVDWTNSSGARLADGTVGAFGTNGTLIQTPHLVPKATVPDPSDVFDRHLGMSTDHFYALCNISGHLPTIPPPYVWNLRKIDKDGAVLLTVQGNAGLPSNVNFSLILGVAVSPENTILYWAGGENVDGAPGSDTVRRFDLVNLVALSDLVTVSDFQVAELMCLPSGPILVLWISPIGAPGILRLYGLTGTLLVTYPFAAGESPIAIALNKDQDSNSFWIYMLTTGANVLREVNTNTGATIQEHPVTA